MSGFDQKFWLEVGCIPRRRKLCFLFPSSVEEMKLIIGPGGLFELLRAPPGQRHPTFDPNPNSPHAAVGMILRVQED